MAAQIPWTAQLTWHSMQSMMDDADGEGRKKRRRREKEGRGRKSDDEVVSIQAQKSRLRHSLIAASITPVLEY